MLKNVQTRVILGSCLLLVTGCVDYILSGEITTAAFYLLPIIIFSYHDDFRFLYFVVFGIASLIIWMIADYHTHPYSEGRLLVINWLLRAPLFVAAPIVTNRFFREKAQRRIIAEQKDSLEKANADLNRFIGMAAHDIRNPVGSIQMIAELMMEEKEMPEDQKNFLMMIHAAAKNSLEILNDTLNISKIQSGTVKLNLVSADYIKFISGCIALNKHLADKKDQTISLETEIASVNISFDKIRLSQVVNNLFTNAIKYSELQKSILVKISYTGEDHSMILLEVIDHGLGIDEKYHATLFEPFVTTSNKPTDNESKTGLGLAIAKKIVAEHKGTIGFRSEKGKGSHFYFTLPVA